jgi:hypothetical protein
MEIKRDPRFAIRRSNRSISRSGNPRCPDFPPFLMRILKRQIVSDSARHGPRCFNLCYISSGVRGESGDWSTAVLVRTASTSIAMESMHSASRNHMDSKYLIEVFTENNPALFSNGPFLSNTRS